MQLCKIEREREREREREIKRLIDNASQTIKKKQISNQGKIAN